MKIPIKLKLDQKVIIIRNNISLEVILKGVSGTKRSREGDIEISMPGKKETIHLGTHDKPYEIVNGVKMAVNECRPSSGSQLQIHFYLEDGYKLMPRRYAPTQ